MRSANQLFDTIKIARSEYETGKETPDRSLDQNVISSARFGFLDGEEQLAVEIYASYERTRWSRLVGAQSVLLTLHHPEDLTPIKELTSISGTFKKGLWTPDNSFAFSRHSAFEGLENDGGYFVQKPPEDLLDMDVDPAVIEALRGMDEINRFLAQQALVGAGVR